MLLWKVDDRDFVDVRLSGGSVSGLCAAWTRGDDVVK